MHLPLLLFMTMRQILELNFFLNLETPHSRDSLVNMNRVFKASFDSQTSNVMNFNTVEHEFWTAQNGFQIY